MNTQRYTIRLLALIALFSGLLAPTLVAGEAGGVPDYKRYGAALKAYVGDKGLVQYRNLKAQPENLDAFLKVIAKVKPKEYSAWATNDKIAFWLNAYNGITLKVIITNYPIKSSFWKSRVYPKNSIRQISGAWDKIRYTVMGKPMTLDQIEHQTLRANFDAPRIHMALVCAAIGCPHLRTEPYVGKRLHDQLADQTRRFLQSSSRFRIDKKKGRVYLSPIFKWFKGDFKTQHGSGLFRHLDDAELQAVVNFIRKHVSREDARWLINSEFDIAYLDYDWTLNEK
jgi:Protein of unknown function, DUF547